MSEEQRTPQSRVRDGQAATQQEAVRFNLYLPREAYDELEELQKMSGKKSLAETIRSALRLYHVVQEGIEDGKEVVLYDKRNNERERLVSL